MSIYSLLCAQSNDIIIRGYLSQILGVFTTRASQQVKQRCFS